MIKAQRYITKMICVKLILKIMYIGMYKEYLNLAKFHFLGYSYGVKVIAS